MPTSSPRLALTLGDPAGIGPEIALKVLADPSLSEQIVVVGDRAVLQHTYQQLRGQATLVDPDRIPVVDCRTPFTLERAGCGQGDAASGSASFAYLEAAIAKTLEGHFDAIVTGPIAKFAWHLAGHHFPGQTEVLAFHAQVERYGMLFVADSPHSGWQMRVLLATAHTPLRWVPQILTPKLVRHKLDLLVESLRCEFGIGDPHIAVAGLNPHSGEGGQMGSEEVDWLIPLLSTYGRARLSGPIPPDSMWVPVGHAWHGLEGSGPADAYLALYHDQGLIPVKLLAFDRAVNTTIGLPFVRTSPDHGTAFDIAGRGIARADSLRAAIRLAADLARARAKTRSAAEAMVER